MRKSRKIAVILLLSFGAMLLVGAVGTLYLTKDASLDENKLPNPYSKVILLDGEDNRINYEGYAELSSVSDAAKEAFIAVEDKRFYSHGGLDIRRMVGALVTDIKAGSFKEGGSTITCQLAKNTHLSGEKTITRKLREAKIALQIEQSYTKDQILEMYLNAIYFGKGIYGIENASRCYFGKSPDTLTPREGATLAAIISNPTAYSPISHFEENQKRAEMILGLMREQGYLSESEYEAEIMSKTILNYNDFHNNSYQIYCNLVLSELSKMRLSVINKPLIVRTYLDNRALSAAEKSLRSYPSTNDAVAEMIIADNHSGGIIAYLSSNGTKRVDKRQPGSLLKPFIYAQAIQDGTLIPDSPLSDLPTSFNGYAPRNYNDRYYGWVDAKFALSHSLNTPAVSVLQRVGVENAAETIRKSGISLTERDKNLALALGGTTYGSDLSEICSGYMTLANYGVCKKLSFIRKVEDAKGKVIYRHTPSPSEVFTRATSYLTTEMLREAAQSGTAKQLSHLPYSIAAKTGTVSKGEGNSDAWCAGYTSAHTFVCRYYAEIGVLPSTLTGGNLPTKAARCALRNLYKDQAPAPFSIPSGILSLEIDRTIKEEMHLLVPAKEPGYGERVAIHATPAFSFDSVDPDELFFGELSLKSDEDGISITFRKREGLTYKAYLNGKKCATTPIGFYAKREAFPLAKLELECGKSGRILYKKAKIVRLYSLISSTEDIASAIKAS